GVDLSRFQPGPPREGLPEVLMIGRFVEKKGFEYGLRAVAHARQRGASLRVSLIGEGERKGRLEALVRDLGLEDSVEFVGVATQDEVAARLRRASVLLAPSVVARGGNRESGLIVVKEAAASGVVPFGTRH